MAPLDRASLLRLVPLAACVPFPAMAGPFLSPTDTFAPLSLAEAENLILRRCDPAFLGAVRATGRLLYRGEGLTTSALCAPPPDLLLPNTYNDSNALAYFRRLEATLPPAVGARPSKGHLASSSLEAAVAWGAPASIWPLGPLSYAWLSSRRDFWPAPPQVRDYHRHAAWERHESVLAPTCEIPEGTHGRDAGGGIN